MGDIGVRVAIELADVNTVEEAQEIVKRVMKSDSHIIDYTIEDVEPLSGDIDDSPQVESSAKD